MSEPSKLSAWLAAARPRTLTAGFVPVVVGVALAARRGPIDIAVAAATLLAALAIQVACNLANDYYDFVRGADTGERLGPLRATQAGLLSPHAVLGGFLACIVVAALVGLGLVAHGGWPILAIGIVSLFLAWAYTGGPYPLAYHGLGDIFVLLFFGVVPVCGTYWLQRAQLDVEVVVLSVPIGLLATALLVVNNLRDIPTDRVAGKRTMAVRLGEAGTRREYRLLVVGAFVVAAAAVALVGVAPLAVAPAALLARAELAAQAARDGAARNESQAGTARLHAVFGLLLAAGLALL